MDFLLVPFLELNATSYFTPNPSKNIGKFRLKWLTTPEAGVTKKSDMFVD